MKRRLISIGVFCLLAVVLFLRIITVYQREHRIPNFIGKGNYDSGIVAKMLIFESSNINLDSFERAILTQYEKNSRFNKVLRIDTFDVESFYFPKEGLSDRSFWSIHFQYPDRDSIKNVYNYDYELRAVDFPKLRLRYSNILIRSKRVYGGYTHYIDSFTYNGTAVKDTFAANVLGIW